VIHSASCPIANLSKEGVPHPHQSDDVEDTLKDIFEITFTSISKIYASICVYRAKEARILLPNIFHHYIGHD
jgi:hypothetical protein